MPIFRVHLEFSVDDTLVRESHDVVASHPDEAGKKARAIVRPRADEGSIIIRKIKLLRGKNA